MVGRSETTSTGHGGGVKSVAIIWYLETTERERERESGLRPTVTSDPFGRSFGRPRSDHIGTRLGTLLGTRKKHPILQHLAVQKCVANLGCVYGKGIHVAQLEDPGIRHNK